eukprot:176343-Hanusia_phi.AAC.2
MADPEPLNQNLTSSFRSSEFRSSPGTVRYGTTLGIHGSTRQKQAEHRQAALNHHHGFNAHMPLVPRRADPMIGYRDKDNRIPCSQRNCMNTGLTR